MEIPSSLFATARERRASSHSIADARAERYPDDDMADDLVAHDTLRPGNRNSWPDRRCSTRPAHDHQSIARLATKISRARLPFCPPLFDVVLANIADSASTGLQSTCCVFAARTAPAERRKLQRRKSATPRGWLAVFETPSRKICLCFRQRTSMAA